MVIIGSTMHDVNRNSRLHKMKNALAKARARICELYRHSMSDIIRVVIFLVLEILWNIQLVVEKYFNNSTRSAPSIPDLTPDVIPPDMQEIIKLPKLKKHRKRGLFFNARCGKRGSYLSLADLMSPAEEKMLMLICAKGYSNAKDYLNDPDMLQTEQQIPRSKFTAIWIESCGN